MKNSSLVASLALLPFLCIASSPGFLGCSDPVERERTPDTAIQPEIREASIEADRTFPDGDASGDIELLLQAGAEVTDADLSLDNVALKPVDASDGTKELPLTCKFSGATPTLKFRPDIPYARVLCTVKNGALEPYCDTKMLLDVSIHSSQCGCSRSATREVTIACARDRRGTKYLELTAGPNPAGKPCQEKETLLPGTLDSIDTRRYSYDSSGRLWFSDHYNDGTTFISRIVYEYTSDGHLSAVINVDKKTALVTSFDEYHYTSDGLLDKIVVDAGDFTGSVTSFSYEAGGNSWTKTSTEGALEDVQEKFTYAPSTKELTIESSLNKTTHMALGNALTSSLVLTAIPDLETIIATAPQEMTFDEDGDGQIDAKSTFEYDQAKLIRYDLRDTDTDGVLVVKEWLYSCP